MLPLALGLRGGAEGRGREGGRGGRGERRWLPGLAACAAGRVRAAPSALSLWLLQPLRCRGTLVSSSSSPFSRQAPLPLPCPRPARSTASCRHCTWRQQTILSLWHCNPCLQALLVAPLSTPACPAPSRASAPPFPGCCRCCRSGPGNSGGSGSDGAGVSRCGSRQQRQQQQRKASEATAGRCTPLPPAWALGFAPSQCRSEPVPAPLVRSHTEQTVLQSSQLRCLPACSPQHAHTCEHLSNAARRPWQAAAPRHRWGPRHSCSQWTPARPPCARCQPGSSGRGQPRQGGAHLGCEP